MDIMNTATSHKYNAERFDASKGHCFNTDPEPDFTPITEQDREEYFQKVDQLIETTRRHLEETEG